MCTTRSKKANTAGTESGVKGGVFLNYTNEDPHPRNTGLDKVLVLVVVHSCFPGYKTSVLAISLHRKVIPAQAAPGSQGDKAPAVLQESAGLPRRQYKTIICPAHCCQPMKNASVYSFNYEEVLPLSNEETYFGIVEISVCQNQFSFQIKISKTCLFRKYF